MSATPGFKHLWNLVDELLILHQGAQHALEAIEDCMASADGVMAPQNAVIAGESGVGKSTLIEVVKRRYPEYETQERTVRPVVVVEVDEVLGTRNLPAWTLKALGDPRPTRGTELDMTNRVYDLAIGQDVKLFMFDEVQHFVEKEKGEALMRRANWFKRLTDKTKAAIVLCGLPSLLGLTAADPQIRGRCGTPIILSRFDWKVPAQQEEFLKILSAFDAGVRQHFDMPSLVEPDMAFRCYCSCGGLMRPLARTLRAAVRAACKKGSSVITLEDLAAANAKVVADIGKLVPSNRPFSRQFFSEQRGGLLENFATVGSSVEVPTDGTTNRSVSAKLGPFGRAR